MYQQTKYKAENVATQKSSIVEINPKVGYFFIDKRTAGIQLSYNRQKQVSPIENVMNSYGFGPFGRYYSLAKDNRVNVLSELGILYNITNGNATNTIKSVDYSVKAGPTVFFNSSVALEALLGYSMLRGKDEIGKTN